MTGVIDTAGIDLGHEVGFSVALVDRAQVQVALAWEFAAAQDVDHHGLVQADDRPGRLPVRAGGALEGPR